MKARTPGGVSTEEQECRQRGHLSLGDCNPTQRHREHRNLFPQFDPKFLCMQEKTVLSPKKQVYYKFGDIRVSTLHVAF